MNKSILTLFPYIISELCPLDLKENVKDTKINDFLMINYLLDITVWGMRYNFESMPPQGDSN
jgi:hypothetical protein